MWKIITDISLHFTDEVIDQLIEKIFLHFQHNNALTVLLG